METAKPCSINQSKPGRETFAAYFWAAMYIGVCLAVYSSYHCRALRLWCQRHDWCHNAHGERSPASSGVLHSAQQYR